MGKTNSTGKSPDKIAAKAEVLKESVMNGAESNASGGRMEYNAVPVPRDASEREVASGKDKEKVKVLIVDDLPHKLTALSSILDEEGLMLVKATSGFDALRRLLQEDFAVILLDVHMPGLDGLETAALIRQRKRSEHTPIIFITANIINDNNLSRGYSLGAVDYIYAPVIPEILRAKVSVFVELFRINRTVKQQARALKSYTLDLELANRKLESRTQELQSSRESFLNIVEKNDEGIAVVDSMGIVRFANKAFAGLLGDPKDEVIGKRFPFPIDVKKTIEIDPPQGNLRVPAELSLTETQWDGRSAFLACLRDITSRRGTEEALRQSDEKLRQAQKLESIGRLAGGVAHDFNNLLTAINGYSDMVLSAMDEADPLKAYLHEVRRSGERAAALTHQLLAYSRKQVLIPKLLNVNNVVDNMTNMLQRLIGDNVEMVAKLAGDLGLVKADPGQLEQVIMNLVVNAKDAMPNGGRILVATAMEDVGEGADALLIDKEVSLPPGRYAVLSVQDTGMGIDEDIRARIFEPFFTTKEVGRGTGLGLSMVYGFVKQSGGNITVTSSPGEGAIFKVYLPLSSGTAVWKPPAELREDPERNRGQETILLVEDELTVRRFLSNVLTQIGYHIIEAQDGRQAMEIESVLVEPIHLLLTDVMMANMGGRELAVKLFERRPDIKILFMSGYAEEPFMTDWEYPSGSEFLQKPFSPEILAQKVREVLDSARIGKT